MKGYFGKPTKSPGLLGIITTESAIAYEGEVSAIYSKCEPSDRSLCTVTFESKVLGKEMVNAWTAMVDGRKTERAAELEAVAKERAAIKSKPDY